MATEEYRDNDYSYNEMHHMRRDVRDAHTAASAAKLMATLALIGAVIALAISIMAWNKANDASGNAQRALNATTTVR